MVLKMWSPDKQHQHRLDGTLIEIQIHGPYPRLLKQNLDVTSYSVKPCE